MAVRAAVALAAARTAHSMAYCMACLAARSASLWAKVAAKLISTCGELCALLRAYVLRARHACDRLLSEYTHSNRSQPFLFLKPSLVWRVPHQHIPWW